MQSCMTDQDLNYRFDWIGENGVNYHQTLNNYEPIIVKSAKNIARTGPTVKKLASG